MRYCSRRSCGRIARRRRRHSRATAKILEEFSLAATARWRRAAAAVASARALQVGAFLFCVSDAAFRWRCRFGDGRARGQRRWRRQRDRQSTTKNKKTNERKQNAHRTRALATAPAAIKRDRGSIDDASI